MSITIGIPKERRSFEYRVGLSPRGVRRLVKKGHICYVEDQAGVGSGFANKEYEDAGARLVFSGEEAYGRADLVIKIQRPTEEETHWFRPGQMIAGFLLLAASRPQRVRAFLEKQIIGIAYELIHEGEHNYPVLHPMSQIGGRMTAQIAAQHLQNNRGGKGILLAGVPGVPPADVVIVGAGSAGTNAARVFSGMGARVIMLDNQLSALQRIERDCQIKDMTTVIAHGSALKRLCAFADVIVLAVRQPGERAPIVLTRDMVRSMRPGSLIIDLSIDQGGAAETSRPTTHERPTCFEEGVMHYCVPNVPSIVARTATHAHLNAAWLYIKQLAAHGPNTALQAGTALSQGIVTYQGRILDAHLKDFAATFNSD